jgi:hypothetical protein
MAFARTIVESHDAQRVIDQEIARDARLSDIYDGLKWRLARQPEIGYRVPKTSPQTYVTHSYHWNTSAIVAAYRFDEDRVEILGLQVIPYSR